MTSAKLQWAEALQAVHAAQTILVVTHVSPDGDAIGALVGLASALRELGKSVVAAVDGGVPEPLKFVPGTQGVVESLDQREWDLTISVDASDEQRTGQVGAYGRAHSHSVVNLDHHVTNVFFGDIYLVDPQAVSACELVFEWLVRIGHRFSREVASALLTGMVTDTLGFRTSNVTSRTLAVAQQLMEAGASLSEITARVLDSKSYNAIELWKQVLPSVSLDGGIISAVVTRANLDKAGLKDTSDGGLIGILITVTEAMIAVVFKETAEGRVELSLRAKPGYDVSQVAFSLNGGGHKQAAGATIDGPLEEACKRVIPLLQAAARQSKALIPSHP